VELPRIEELLRSLMQGLPPGLASGASGLREDLENNFRAVLRANRGKLDLTGREEFDAQRKVLERTRARLEELEKRIKAARMPKDARKKADAELKKLKLM
jgi:hypothetical protein